jgi:DNA-binding CsgD family transcriptional regulator
MASVAKVIREKSKKNILGKMLVTMLEKQKALKKKRRYSEFEGVNRLTDRHIQITKLLLDGYSYAEIAKALSLAANTVRSHAKRIYILLRVRGRRTMHSELSDEEIALIRKRFDELAG